MDLSSACKIAQKFAPNETVIDSLKTIQIGNGEICAHDLRKGVIISVGNDSGINGLSCAADAQRLTRSILSCGDKIKLKLDENTRTLTISGDGGVYQMTVEDIRTTPRIKRPPHDAKWIDISGDDLANVDRVKWARDDDKSRLNMRGVYIDGQYLRCISGHCLSSYRMNGDLLKELNGNKEPIAFDPEPLGGLSVEKAQICLGKDNLFLRTTDEIRVIPLYDAAMPRFGNLYEKALKVEPVTVNRLQLHQTVKKALITSRVRDLGICFTCGMGCLTVRSEDNDQTFTFQHILDLIGQSAAEGFVTLNGRYVVSALEAIDTDEVNIHCQWITDGSLAPVLFVGKNSQSIIMPMRP